MSRIVIEEVPPNQAEEIPNGFPCLLFIDTLIQTRRMLRET